MSVTSTPLVLVPTGGRLSKDLSKPQATVEACESGAKSSARRALERLGQRVGLGLEVRCHPAPVREERAIHCPAPHHRRTSPGESSAGAVNSTRVRAMIRAKSPDASRSRDYRCIWRCSLTFPRQERP